MNDDFIESTFKSVYIDKSQFSKDGIIRYYIYYIYIDGIYKLYVKFRPGIKELLNLLFKYYELYIFSQGEKEYVLKILSYLDKDKYFFIFLLF